MSILNVGLVKNSSHVWAFPGWVHWPSLKVKNTPFAQGFRNMNDNHFAIFAIMTRMSYIALPLPLLAVVDPFITVSNPPIHITIIDTCLTIAIPNLWACIATLLGFDSCWKVLWFDISLWCFVLLFFNILLCIMNLLVIVSHSWLMNMFWDGYILDLSIHDLLWIIFLAYIIFNDLYD